MPRASHAAVEVARSRDVVTLTLRLTRGRLDVTAHAELVEACDVLDHDDDLRAVVVRSRGKHFCLGDDAGVGPDSPDGIAAVGRLRVPTVAVLGGDAIDAGLELALACDLRIAVEGAQMGLTQLLAGRTPFHGGTQRLPRIAGPARSARMLLLGEIWGARLSLEAGLVQVLSKRLALATDVRKIVRALCERAPVAQRMAKETLRAAADLPLGEGLRLEGDLYVLLQTTRDRNEGVASFHEKRRPRFEGR